jgi:hypothetical protein
MKNIFTLLLSTVSVFAFAYDGGRLTITVPSSKNIQVYVDGRAYQQNDNSIVLNNIQPGNHTITVYKNSRNGYENNGTYGRNKQRDKKNSRGDVLYSSNVYVRPSYHVDVMVNRFGKALVDERIINGSYSNDDDDLYDNPSQNGGYNNGGYNGSNQQAMADYDFNQLIQKIRNQWLGKLSAARDGINGNYFNTSQVRQIVQIFSSETDRLELAKLSYRKTVDRQNYRQLYDLLSYQSQSELDSYIRDFR